MRQHGHRRIVAMGTLSIVRPEDLLRGVVHASFANAIYRNMLNIAEVFETEAHGLDWTVFRITSIPGEYGEASWRENGETFVGWIG